MFLFNTGRAPHLLAPGRELRGLDGRPFEPALAQRRRGGFIVVGSEETHAFEIVLAHHMQAKEVG